MPVCEHCRRPFELPASGESPAQCPHCHADASAEGTWPSGNAASGAQASSDLADGEETFVGELFPEEDAVDDETIVGEWIDDTPSDASPSPKIPLPNYDQEPQLRSQPVRSSQRWLLPDQPESSSEPVAHAYGDVAPTSAFIPPPLREEHSSADDIETLPLASVIDDDAPPANSPFQPLPRANVPSHSLRRRHRARLLTFLALCALAMAGLSATAFFFMRGPDATEEWASIQDDYQQHKWRLAEQRLEEFAAKHPDDPHAGDVPFFLDMSQAGRHIFSQTGELDQGMSAIDAVFQKYRDTPQYTAYRADLYLALQRLIDRSTDIARKTNRPEPLAVGQQAFALLSTVGAAMPDDWVPAKTESLSQSLADAQSALTQIAAKRELLDLLTNPAAADATDEMIDARTARTQELLETYPAFAKQKDVVEALASQHRGEASRVTYTPIGDEDAQAPPAPSDVDPQDVFVVWDEPTGPKAPGKVFLALARGVLYAFDSNGNELWCRRLGFDSLRVPLSLPATDSAPAAFIAVSSHDNTLVALSQATGSVLWQYQAAGQDLSAPLTITTWRRAPNRPAMVRGLLPTAEGEIHVLELSRGKRMGTFHTGLPMSVGGVFDPGSQLAFFPADAKRIVAIDPGIIDDPSEERSAARSVAFTNHASGALRSAPVVVGPYLVTTEAADLDRTTVRAFEISPTDGFSKANAEPLAEATLNGWSWFAPPTLADRLTIATDAGETKVFGVNFDNPEEALFPLIGDKKNAARPNSADSFRALAVQADDDLLWVMSGGSLRHLSLDLFRQEWKTVWPKAGEAPQITGVPLHEAAFDSAAGRLYVATRSLTSDEAALSAVDSETGSRVWQRRLGFGPLIDPIVQANGVTLLDRSGRLMQLAISGDSASLTTTRDQIVPPAAAKPARWLPETNGSNASLKGTLLLQLDADGTRLGIRQLGSTRQPTQWQQVLMPNGVGLRGTPALVGDHLVAPGSDGRLHRVPLASTEAQLNEQTYAWAQPGGGGPEDEPHVVALSDHTILLLSGNEGQWLEFSVEDAIGRWKPLGPPLLAQAPLVGKPLVQKDFLFLTDSANHVYRVARQKPESDPPFCTLSAPITLGPFAISGHDDRIFVVTADHNLACHSAAAIDGAPLWEKALPSRICGRPALLGKYLLITEEVGRITAVKIEDGQQVGVVSLDPGQVPAAAATPFGKGRIVIPLADGTLLWRLLKPPAPAKATP